MPNWRLPSIDINEGPPFDCIDCTFGLNWNNISFFKFIKVSVYLSGGVLDGAEIAFVDKINLCDGRIIRVSPLILPRYMASVVEGAKCIRVCRGLRNDEFLASKADDLNFSKNLINIELTFFAVDIFDKHDKFP